MDFSTDDVDGWTVLNPKYIKKDIVLPSLETLRQMRKKDLLLLLQKNQILKKKDKITDAINWLEKEIDEKINIDDELFLKKNN